MSEPTREAIAAGRGDAIEAATRAIRPVALEAEATYPLSNQQLAAYIALAAEAAVDAVLAVVGPRIAAAERDQLRQAIEALPEYAYTRADKPGVLFRGLNRGAVLAVVAAHPVLGLLGGDGNNN